MGKYKINAGAVRLLRRREVEARTGLSRSTIYEWIRLGNFPRPIALGTRAVRWQEHDVDQWIAGRVANEVKQEGGQ